MAPAGDRPTGGLNMRRPTLEPGIVIQRGAVALFVAVGAASAMGNIFVDNGWVVPTAVAVLTAVGLSLLWQLLRVPTPVAVGLSMAAGLAWISAWWPLSSELAWRARPAALIDGLRLANQQIMTQIAPTPTLNGLLLITVAGTFLASLACAELMARRSVLTALLAALGLWVVPLSVPVPGRGVLWPSLALLIPSAVALAVVSDPSSGTRDQPVRLRWLAAIAGVAMVMAAIPIATALPGHGGVALIDLRGLGTTLEGSQPLVDVGDQLHLPTPRLALRVSTDAPAYLRTAALEIFDGTTWRIGSDIGQTSIPSSQLEDPSNGIATNVAPVGRATSWDVTVQSLPGTYLPVVNQPTRVASLAGSASLSFSQVGDFVTTDSITNLVEADPLGADYSIEAVVPTPTVQDLTSFGLAVNDLDLQTQLPGGQDQLVAEARRIVEASGATTAVDQALAIQDHFAGPGSDFVYSTDVPGLRGSDALETFVLDTRVGYCEYYATAMAVMLRGLGIPTRVATGYLPGRELLAPTASTPGTYQVSSTDAHAWVEVAFAEAGWVTFDPTPRSDTAGLRPSRDALTAFAPNGGTAQQPIDAPTDDLLQAGEAPQLPSDAPAPVGRSEGADGGTSATNILAGLAGLAALAVLATMMLGVAWWWAHRRRTSQVAAERVVLAQSHLLVTAAALGRARHTDESIHDVTARWIASGDVDAPAAQLVAREASRVAFGGPDVDVTDVQADAMEDAAQRVSAQLRDAASRRDRMLAEFRVMTIGPEDG